MITVSFEPDGKTGQFEAGLTILEAAERLAVGITAPCGGHGRCGNCQVFADGELSPLSEAECDLLSEGEREDGLRLACEARVQGDARITVPAGSRTVGGKILSEDAWQGVPLAPNVALHHLSLPEPTLEDQRSDVGRLAAGLGIDPLQLQVDHDVLARLTATLHSSDFTVDAVTVGDRLANVLPAGRGRVLGAALDIGTTTVVAHLVDLDDGERLATASALNPQARYGHDLISRIEHAQEAPTGMADLRGAIVELVNQLIAEAAGEAGASTDDVYEVTVVGNTCMHHLFVGLDPRYLARAPYVPVIKGAVELSATESGLEINRGGTVYCVPVIAGFVGADSVAVLVASEITSRSHPTLAIDIGTNGEVMLWSGERLLVTSCAAGPAFEGGETSRGVRAAEGAIERVWLRNGEIGYATIGGAPANGICGSGIFDIVAALLDSGAADSMGRLADDEGAGSLDERIAARLRGEGAGREFVLVEADDDGEVAFTQRDLREVQLAKGAVRAAVELLSAEAGIAAEEIEEVLVAGAFGNYIDPRSALRMGLLPDVGVERIQGIGNAAGAGALATLISVQQRERAVELAGMAEHIELMASPRFQVVFADSMIFPDTVEDGANTR